MKKWMLLINAAIFIFGWSIQISPAQPGERIPASADQQISWQRLADGLEIGVFRAGRLAESGDSIIHILRIDPAAYEFRLLNASATEDGQLLTARQWCRRHGMVAAINASMYQTDYKSSVSLMRTHGHINNPRLSKDMTILAFDRRSANVPLVKIIDRQCEDFQVWKKKYNTLVQSIRMISCTGRNVWRQQPQKWSTAAIGTDQNDRVLFIHVRSLYSTHDLINVLQSMPIGISRAMYAEGGPEAQLYVKAGQNEFEFTGSHFTQNNIDLLSHPIPNVIGIVAREKVPK
jgi:hypothetical protein